MSMKEHTKISPETRRKVRRRDKDCCVLCGKPWFLECAHYISRAQGGMGIPENLVMLCRDCHFKYDNGGYRKEFGRYIRDYLNSTYKNWDEKKLVYDKYSWVGGNDED